MFTIALQIPPPLNCSGDCVRSCHISASFSFHVSSALTKFCTTQLSESTHFTSLLDFAEGPAKACPSTVALFTWFFGSLHQPVIRVKISFAKVMMTPPARVKNPLERWLGSWDCKDNPTCTMPQPSRINPTARIKPKMKSDRLLMTASGSLAAYTVVVPAVIISTSAAYTAIALFVFLPIGCLLVSLLFSFFFIIVLFPPCFEIGF